jgi:hypothetical protein
LPASHRNRATKKIMKGVAMNAATLPIIAPMPRICVAISGVICGFCSIALARPRSISAFMMGSQTAEFTM